MSGIDLVWVALAGLYGSRFTTPFGVTPDGVPAALWRTTLGGLSEADLRTGIAALMASGEDFPPSAPAFRALCLEVLSADEVRADLRRQNEERHPFTRMVWMFMDTFAFTQGDDWKAREALTAAYAAARKARMEGHPLPPRPKAALTDARASKEPINPGRAAAANPAKVTRKGAAIADAFAQELHPRRYNNPES